MSSFLVGAYTLIGRSMLPFEARQHFLANGFALVRQALRPAAVEQLRAAGLAAAAARQRQLCEIPRMDSIFRKKSNFSDPSLTALTTHLERRRYVLQYLNKLRRRRKERAKVVKRFLKGRRREELTGEDVWKLSVLLEKEVNKPVGVHCTSTIHNDLQLLQAISQYRANLWMTNEPLQSVLRSSEVARALGDLSETVGGVEKPVIFSDAPLHREAFGNGVAFQCTAPALGVKTVVQRPTAAVTLIVFTFTPSPLCFDPHVLVGSHLPVRTQLQRQPNLLMRLFSPFLLCESHMPFQLQHFDLGSEVHGRRLLDVLQTSKKTEAIQPGDVLVVDPHLMMGFGPNFTDAPELLYRLNVVSEDARPYMKSPSWIRGWRSLPHEVSFNADIVFPKLYG